MAGSLATEELGSGRIMRTYDPTSADVDLVAEGQFNEPCRWITVVGSGTLVVTGTDDTDVTLPDMGQNWTHVGAFKTIKDTSTATSVIVAW